jgi:hypothetical protein
MIGPTPHNWDYYADQCEASDRAWIRSQGVGEKFALYESLFDAIQKFKSEEETWARLESHRWSEKLASRRRNLDAFSQLDRLKRERSAP